MRDPAPWQKRYETMLVLSLLFGLISQYLFVGSAAGVSVIVFVLGFYSLFFYAVKGRIGGFEKWQGQFSSGWLLMIPIVLLTLSYAFFANSIFRSLNVLALFALIIAQTMLVTRSGAQPWHRARFYKDMIVQGVVKPLSHIAVPFSLIGGLLKTNSNDKKANSHIRKIGLGLLLAAPLLIVVVSLLASADQIFLSWLNKIPNLFQLNSSGDGVWRVIVAGSIAWYSFCYIWGLLFRKPKDDSNGLEQPAVLTYVEGLEKKPRERLEFDPITAGTLLLSINLVYLLFVAIQFSYLFGAANGMLPEGAAYADYARRGFAELVMVALINLVVLLCGLYLIRPAGKTAELIRKLLLSLLIGCTTVMLISAYSRLSLYEDAYGFTQARLLVHGFMVFLGILLAVALVRIWKVRFSLAKVYICTAIVAYLIMNYVNLDARIAVNNINRFERSAIIDIAYLHTLSTDAAPALYKFYAKHPDLEGLEGVIKKQKSAAHSDTSWQSWSVSKQRAK